MAEQASDVVPKLQGVWFMTRVSEGGRITRDSPPCFPAGPDDPWLMTIRGDRFHVTANSDYDVTGGRFLVNPEAGQLTHVYPELPEGWVVHHDDYRFVGEELLLHCDRVEWCERWETTTSLYVRVAPEATPEMVTLIENMMQYREPTADRTDHPSSTPSRAVAIREGPTVS